MTKGKKKEWNFIESDGKDMTPLDKGKILYYHKLGKKPKEIAGLTGRSMEWIKLITGAITSYRDRDKLINLYVNKLNKEQSHGDTVTKKKAGVRVSSTSKSSTNKTGNSKRTKRTVSRGRNNRRNTIGNRKRNDSSTSNSKQGIADSLRKSKDYKGE